MTTAAGIRWGVIGCGDVTEVKSGPALQRARDSSLVAVMRRNGALAEDYARRHGVPRWYDDAQRLVDDPSVDAVYVATPPSTHLEFALMALRAGKPVYVEKPMALDAAECEAMLRESRARGLPVYVAYYRRALPRFLKVRSLLEAGAIGTPQRVEVRLARTLQAASADPPAMPWRVRPEISGGGLFVDLGSHTLDLLDFLFGPLREVEGEATNRAGAYAAEDTVAMDFAFDNGMRGSGDWCFCADQRADEVVVSGDRGELRFATFDDVPIVVADDGGRHEHRIANPPHIQQPLVETVVAGLLDTGTCPSTGDSAARTTAVIDRVLADYRAGAGRRG
jgi:1,5-anhydro-D-fructose reductase (1,5-anhydro-D-mannitol-forming)